MRMPTYLRLRDMPQRLPERVRLGQEQVDVFLFFITYA